MNGRGVILVVKYFEIKTFILTLLAINFDWEKFLYVYFAVVISSWFVFELLHTLLQPLSKIPTSPQPDDSLAKMTHV